MRPFPPLGDMDRTFTRRWLRAGLACALSDGLWALALTAYSGRPTWSVWNGVASVVFGPKMLEAGLHGILVGLCLHLIVAFTWSAVFVAAATRSPLLQRAISTRAGRFATAAFVGPFIWITMSGLAIPTMTGRALVITGRWFVQLVGHAVFVGLPIVWGARTRHPTASP
ncbi:MAG: hypothetical protein K8S21_13535 [Gemmatimonadetes bacterium]|nr:hypothetical protein [Gemmatimonadota bacterium]